MSEGRRETGKGDREGGRDDKYRSSASALIRKKRMDLILMDYILVVAL